LGKEVLRCVMIQALGLRIKSPPRHRANQFSEAA
jgi:hypothetical protein